MNKKHVHSQSMFIWIWNDVDMYLNSPLHSTAFFGLNKCIPRTPRHQFSTAKPSFALEVPGFAHGAKGVDQNPRSQAFGRGILGIQPGKNVNDACIYMHMYIYIYMYNINGSKLGGHLGISNNSFHIDQPCRPPSCDVIDQGSSPSV